MNAWPRALAGLWVGLPAWAVATQAGLSLGCGTSGAWCIMGAVLAAAAGASSWRVAAEEPVQRFAAQLGALLGLCFAFALILQALGPLLLPAC